MRANPVGAVEPGREFVLTVSCADRRGIVHAVSGVMLELSMTILDSQQFADTTAGEFHLRMHLAREGSALAVEDLDAAMHEVATEFAMTYAVHDLSQRRRALVLVSQQGHCLNDLLFRVESGSLPLDVPAIVSNHEDFRGLAEWHGIPFHHVPVTPETKPAAESELRRLVELYSADTIALARYMQILSSGLCADFPGRIINIHHSLLPSFKGAKPYSQAHDRGVKVIGATAHYVTADLDEGPIIEQDFRRVDHRMSPTELASVGQELEAMAFARALRWHAEHRVVLRGRRTIVFD
ncbi:MULTISPECIES: formyltetrahydrofolate deformylase [unclassified Phycicoccus]|uniref:formyltetrahydrofolate deformylase n=1 Tax=unclassified Phycicoccus TaxID=2637926 RepID=UPI0007034973|nr:MULTISPECIES: formyltetrahydrofolate deformylase [unclassified Phycicoccus]KRF25485.1 formyltetrahydrofolate deformylase [Phycicoccus sp. Soil803]KRF27904.1 formyltetrahydrofolate deformylase [Phycicoccus sp. Soil802]